MPLLEELALQTSHGALSPTTNLVETFQHDTYLFKFLDVIVFLLDVRNCVLHLGVRTTKELLIE